MTLTDEQYKLLKNLKKVAIELEENGKSLTWLIGELSVCQILDLKWEPTEGYDALSNEGEKFQIKTRIIFREG